MDHDFVHPNLVLDPVLSQFSLVPVFTPLFLQEKAFLIFSTHLRLYLPMWPLPSMFATRNVGVVTNFLVRATCRVHLVLHLNTLVQIVNKYSCFVVR